MNARILQFAVFLSVATLLTAGMHRLLWARLVRDPGWPEPWPRALTAVLVGLAVTMVAALPLQRALPRPVAGVLAMVAFGWMGLSFVLVVGTLGAEIVRGAYRLLAGAHDPERRQSLARGLAALVGVGGTLAGAWGIRTALGRWRVETVRVPVANLPASLEGFTIVQVTDIHVGPTIGRGFVDAMVRAVNDLRPDAVAITGDLVDGSVASLGEHVAPLAGLRARHGVFFVTGNHEYYSGVDEWLAELGRLGVRVLANERVTLGGADGAIDLAGVHDWSGRRHPGPHKPDLAKALAGRDPARPVVLLAHQPKQAREAAAHGVALVLSGHTHGGQIWPWGAVVALDQTYVKGLHREGATHIYVNQGTGYWGPPMRLGTAPEITRVVLTRA
ncbi:MAG: metallophosphoesterase [Polyangiales bacterium]